MDVKIFSQSLLLSQDMPKLGIDKSLFNSIAESLKNEMISSLSIFLKQIVTSIDKEI